MRNKYFGTSSFPMNNIYNIEESSPVGEVEQSEKVKKLIRKSDVLSDSL